jgi:hypothetical protein
MPVVQSNNSNTHLNNDEIALELVKEFLGCNAYCDKNLKNNGDITVGALQTAARMDGLYIASLYVSTKSWLNKLNNT